MDATAQEPGAKLSTTERRQLAADISEMVAQEQAQEMPPQQQLDAWTAQAMRQLNRDVTSQRGLLD